VAHDLEQVDLLGAQLRAGGKGEKYRSGAGGSVGSAAARTAVRGESTGLEQVDLLGAQLRALR